MSMYFPNYSDKRMIKEWYISNVQKHPIQLAGDYDPDAHPKFGAGGILGHLEAKVGHISNEERYLHEFRNGTLWHRIWEYKPFKPLVSKFQIQVKHSKKRENINIRGSWDVWPIQIPCISVGFKLWSSSLTMRTTLRFRIMRHAVLFERFILAHN